MKKVSLEVEIRVIELGNAIKDVDSSNPPKTGISGISRISVWSVDVD